MAQSDKEQFNSHLPEDLAKRVHQYRGDRSKSRAVREIVEASLNVKAAFALSLGERLLFMSIFVAIVGIPLPVLELRTVAAMTITLVVVGVVCIAYAFRSFEGEP